jgi:hypothetical protein
MKLVVFKKCLNCGSNNLIVDDYALEEIQIGTEKPEVCKMIVYICKQCGKKSIW